MGAGWQPGRQPYPPLPQVQVWWWGAQAGPAATSQPAALVPVRIGDAERDAALSALGDHFSAGRLTREELDERTDRALRTRFETELTPLFADLPAGAPEAAPSGRRHSARAQGWGPPLLWLLPLLVVGAVVGAIVWHAPFLVWLLVWVVVITKMTAARRRSRRWRQGGGTLSQPGLSQPGLSQPGPWSAGRR